MCNYDEELEKNNKRNEKFIKEFKTWLKVKKLSTKTINKHLSNIDLYLNDYLTYSDITKMEDGISRVYGFLDDWFIRKCLFASKTSIKENAASIKKFYQCMSEKGYVDIDEYKYLCEMLSERMDKFFKTLEEYDNMIEEEWF